MQLSLKTLVRDVRVAMDENVTDDGLQLLREVNTLTLDELISHQVETAAQLVLSGANVELLEGGKSFLGSSVSFLGRGIGRVQLPADFLRFLYFRMSDWDYGVTDYIVPEDRRYAVQFGRWAGLRGSPHRPVVALVPSDGGMSLEFFSSSGSVEEARYVAKPRLQGAGDDCVMDFPLMLKDALVNEAAALACQKLGAVNEASMLNGTAAALMRGASQLKMSQPPLVPLAGAEQMEGANVAEGGA